MPQESDGNVLVGRRRFHLIACRVLWREINYYSAQSPHDINVTYLEQGLHNTPDRLRATVQEQIDRTADGRFDAILLGYGLCSNGIVGIRVPSIPLVVPRAHDCITFLLGSKERYREHFDSHPGTYWFSPGWIDCSDMPGPDRIEKTFRDYCEKYGEENARYLMERMEDWYRKYDRVAYVDLGFGETSRYKEFARWCAKGLGWNYEELRGDPTLFQRFLEGCWDKEDFLMVAPGGEIAGDYNSPTIIRAK